MKPLVTLVATAAFLVGCNPGPVDKDPVYAEMEADMARDIDVAVSSRALSQKSQGLLTLLQNRIQVRLNNSSFTAPTNWAEADQNQHRRMVLILQVQADVAETVMQRIDYEYP